MEFDRLVRIVGEEPVFETGLLLSGDISPADVRRQLSRWTKAGKISQLRRGLYVLAPPFQKVKPHPFVIANRMVHASYVSLQSALAYYGLIPEYVPVVTSVTTSRPGCWNTPFGTYDFHHIKTAMFRGYKLTVLTENQRVFVATPEKALLDMIYLQVGGDCREYLEELRLQNMESLALTELKRWANLSGRPKLQRAAAIISDMADAEREEYKEL